MKDTYIDNVSHSKLDMEISRIAKEVEQDELGGGPMTVGIQNENGEVYRVITTYGLSSYMDLVFDIADLGLTDIYANKLDPADYDSLFIFDK